MSVNPEWFFGKRKEQSPTYEELVGLLSRRTAERDDLRDRLEKAEKAMEQQKDEWLSWQAKREQLGKDAARYRWLRAYLPSDDVSCDDAIVAALTPEEIDAAIDAAMEAK